MIAFGCAVSEPEAYERYAGRGIALARETDSAELALAAVGSTARSCNLVLDAAAGLAELEALVLLHPHAELTDPAFAAKVRGALREPGVAVVGAAGARGVRSLAWWEGEVVSAAVVHRYSVHGGGELENLAWAGPRLPPPGEVDTVDGCLMVLSPWAVRTLRFDENIGIGHCFDLDFCLQARAAGRRVMVADLGLAVHRELELIPETSLWLEAHVRMAEKWPGLLGGADPPHGTSWKERARRAEAEREAERAVAYGYALERDARVLQLRRRLAEVTGTPSWRLTQPLRSLNKAVGDRRDLRRGGG